MNGSSQNANIVWTWMVWMCAAVNNLGYSGLYTQQSADSDAKNNRDILINFIQMIDS